MRFAAGKKIHITELQGVITAVFLGQKFPDKKGKGLYFVIVIGFSKANPVPKFSFPARIPLRLRRLGGGARTNRLSTHGRFELRGKRRAVSEDKAPGMAPAACRGGRIGEETRADLHGCALPHCAPPPAATPPDPPVACAFRVSFRYVTVIRKRKRP